MAAPSCAALCACGALPFLDPVLSMLLATGHLSCACQPLICVSAARRHDAVPADVRLPHLCKFWNNCVDLQSSGIDLRTNTWWTYRKSRLYFPSSSSTTCNGNTGVCDSWRVRCGRVRCLHFWSLSVNVVGWAPVLRMPASDLCIGSRHACAAECSKHLTYVSCCR
jgi:hypothetical protein